MKVSDSEWHKLLSQAGTDDANKEQLDWLEPFQNSQTFCPYLVGSYDVVAVELV